MVSKNIPLDKYVRRLFDKAIEATNASEIGRGSLKEERNLFLSDQVNKKLPQKELSGFAKFSLRLRAPFSSVAKARLEADVRRQNFIEEMEEKLVSKISQSPLVSSELGNNGRLDELGLLASREESELQESEKEAKINLARAYVETWGKEAVIEYKAFGETKQVIPSVTEAKRNLEIAKKELENTKVQLAQLLSVEDKINKLIKPIEKQKKYLESYEESLAKLSGNSKTKAKLESKRDIAENEFLRLAGEMAPLTAEREKLGAKLFSGQEVLEGLGEEDLESAKKPGNILISKMNDKIKELEKIATVANQEEALNAELNKRKSVIKSGINVIREHFRNVIKLGNALNKEKQQGKSQANKKAIAPAKPKAEAVKKSKSSGRKR